MNRFGGLALLGPYLRPYRGRTILALLSLLVAAGTVLAFGACLRALIDRGFAQGRPDILNYALASLLAVAVVLAIASGARFYLVSWLGERVVGDLRRDLFDHVVRLGPAWFEIKRSGDVMSRISADAQLIEQVIGSSASVALRNTLMCIGGVVMLVVTNPKLALWTLAVVPLTVVPIIVFGRQVKALSRESQARMGEMVSEGAETLDGVRTVQAFAQEDRATQRFGEATERAFVAATRRVSRRAIMTTLVIFIVFSAVGFLLWMGGHDVLTGRISAGDLSAFVFYAVLVASSGGAISETVGDLQRASGAAERLAELRAEAPSIAEPAHPKPLPKPVQGAVSFEEVSFRYPTRTDALALDRFDLAIVPGETVAIVGPSGAGKTTAFNLLLRFYDPEKGTIRLDGIDIRDLALGDLRRSLAVVPQDPTLFSTSVTENIRYGRPDASDAEVRAAADAASALGFIEALPHGFATDLGARGVRLSGGQRQRIAIARALLCDPAVLLLDEATSALDAESELAVQQALDRVMRNRTTLVIAHRLATVQKANRIVVLDQGRVVDIGTHAELVRRGGLYARLAELQFNVSTAAS
ncbi:ABC transporter transmembrane domain-containing protein [Reyranella sp.]|jgi:ATP-binding cassette subfamily B protein|uniref:ABC transporter transmembrane domain-containing protein n=1 Tax=Reyranella sp. TaxID=1929291 RepID=UPI000BD0DF57|nr:ABC transporter transmembrane domain-containing protein [Reyranella sp.]OYY33716.1 MAG: ABC transporter [Rhodospirillales bacterium 35-66-84]OYZ90779.1 MAG: ABC transporter [Rhodospirillales bacterium 24-66-33]OZB21073.1 MAG: ABC transporter [Rhodospirillales bacterium 39-66-50]HQS19326.1 ABC transporter transmembrane domain-containing protein [Reyranella sp.]HQT15637.1 ABC transporter transmembrane domain-containing protein [Reyranella sp.]